MTLDQVAQRGLVLLGCGKMGSAMLAGWLEGGLPPASVHVMTPNPSDWLKGTGVHINGAVPLDAAIALLAVKPQKMAEALPRLAPLGGGATLFLSVAAGLTLARYEAMLGAGTPVVRAMPNTPSAVGRGITALVANSQVTEADMQLAEALLSAVGDTVRLEHEDQMDTVSAISGCGPAYVFHLIEALAEAGVAEGLSPDLAMRLARATITGAGELAHQSPDDARQLRVNVTSPGGMTAAGLAVLMQDLPDLIHRTVRAAAERGRELGA
ncbi:pyrroline-5-carboxylate reductase [Falsirhodobacter sp. 20TX0035]|uniref:pyrroline-5-carboxylate reductase n=1 Tax=Falsirhodobacter sp. 20TX0035 TaxID=3022019 RepID=UPI00232FBFDD|nr:pyrroline-5-carboxylate reductase [Falsirhodobacter sp. 20TX0035]MDB6452298.1 pyrroline-5-carboxylate reductase [Falsirhodobacter sp. 20TX0035]